MAISKIEFSASTDGKRILLGDSGGVTLLHTADASAKDAIWLNFHNSVDAVKERVTIQFGGVAGPDDFIKFDVPAEGDGLWWAIRGDLLTNSLLLRAFSETANVVTAGGWVVRDTGP